MTPLLKWLNELWGAAQAHAGRRRHGANLLLLLAFPLWLGLWLVLLDLALELSALLYPGRKFANMDGPPAFMMAIGSLFATLPIALLLINAILHLFRPVREVLEHEAKEVRGTDYRSAQRNLLKFAVPVVGLALLLVITGIFWPA